MFYNVFRGIAETSLHMRTKMVDLKGILFQLICLFTNWLDPKLVYTNILSNQYKSLFFYKFTFQIEHTVIITKPCNKSVNNTVSLF